jgi:hypothetical protein
MLDLDSFSSALDPGIARAVLLLRQAGIATVESCEGGPGHCFPEPTVRFEGSRAEAWRAFAEAMDHGLPVLYLRNQWTISSEGDPEGPYWEIVFRGSVNPSVNNGHTS